MEKSSYVAGSFCWADLQAKDSAASKQFYAALFGWEMIDRPVAPGVVYTMCRVRGKDVCAINPMSPDMAATGMPSLWTVYVAVDDADATQKAAVAAGGAIALPAMDVMDEGRMGFVQDPTGATVGLWQPKNMKGAALFGETGAMVWHELMSRDVAKAKAFYTQVFGWSTYGAPMGEHGEYTLFRGGEAKDWRDNRAGMMGMPPNVPAMVPSYWGVYFAVDSCDAAVKKAQELGAQVVVPPTDVPGTGRFATLVDPQGAMVSVLEAAPM